MMIVVDAEKRVNSQNANLTKSFLEPLVVVVLASNPNKAYLINRKLPRTRDERLDIP